MPSREQTCSRCPAIPRRFRQPSLVPAKKRCCGARVAEPLVKRAIAHSLREHLMARILLTAGFVVAIVNSLSTTVSRAEEVKCEGVITAIDGDIVIVKDA